MSKRKTPETSPQTEETTPNAVALPSGQLVTGANALQACLLLPANAANPLEPDTQAWLTPYPNAPRHKSYSLAAISLGARLGLNQTQCLELAGMSEATYHNLPDDVKEGVKALIKRGNAWCKAKLVGDMDMMQSRQPAIAIFKAKNLLGWKDTVEIGGEQMTTLKVEHTFLMPNVRPVIEVNKEEGEDD